MLGAAATTFLVLVVVFSPVGARHAVPERAISTHAPSTETALPMFAFEFSIPINASTTPRSFARHGLHLLSNIQLSRSRRLSVAQAILPAPQRKAQHNHNCLSRPASVLRLLPTPPHSTRPYTLNPPPPSQYY